MNRSAAMALSMLLSFGLPYREDQVRFIINKFRQAFPDSILADAIKRWPKNMEDWIVSMNKITAPENETGRKMLAKARIQHEEKRQYMINNLRLLLIEKESPNEFENAVNVEALQNLVEYEAKQRSWYLRRLPTRLARIANPQYRYEKKQRRKLRISAAASGTNPSNTKMNTDFSEITMGFYFDHASGSSD